MTGAGLEPRVVISDPGDVAAAVPHLLGFHPAESLVLISLAGASGSRISRTLRADLPPAGCAAPFAVAVARNVAADGADACVVVVVSDAPDAGGREPELPHRELIHELLLAFSAEDLPVRDLLLVRGGRWWSYDCPHACCAPGAGTPLPGGTSQVAAASVTTGTVVARDRDELAGRIAPPEGPELAAMVAACVRAGVQLATRVAAAGVEPVAEETWAAIGAAVRRCRPGRRVQPLSDDEVARILCGLRDPVVRDRALGFALGDDADAALQLWTACTRRAPAPLDAAPATLLAVSAWLRGEGALAGIALDRALAGDPDYLLAGLLACSLDAGIRPAEIRAVVAATVAALTDSCDARA